MEWNERRVRAIVREAVAKKWHLFQPFKDLSREDLEQDCMIRAVKMHQTFNRARANYSTWITRGVNFRLLDIRRDRLRCAKRDEAAVKMIVQRASGSDFPDPDHADVTEDTAAWLRRVYQAATVARPRQPREGRPGYHPAAAVAAGALMRRMQLSSRKAQQVLHRRRDLRQAMQLESVPGQKWFTRAVKERVLTHQNRRKK